MEQTLYMITEHINDAKQYGLEAEVIYSALLAMKENPSLSIEDAIAIGCDEWDV